jgi:SLOG cluster3 family
MRLAGMRLPSLKEMRRTMISSHEFDAGISIGGAEGVQMEFELFREILAAAWQFKDHILGVHAKQLHTGDGIAPICAGARRPFS